MFNIRSSNASGGDGAEVIYALRNNSTLSDSIGLEFIEAGQNYRSSYQRRLPSDSSLDYYYMHRDTPENETIIVEYGFLDSTGDDVTLIKNSWEKLAEAVVKAVVIYIGVTYVPLEENNIYIVKSGDTLYSIANSNNTTVTELKSLNNLTSDILSIGQTIYLPGYNEEITSYVVKSGDSLYSIANKFGLTVDKLKEINNLDSDLLSIGQILFVKELEYSENPDTYTVESGDTLYSIASKFNLTVDELKLINNLSTDILSVGQILNLNSNDKEDQNDSSLEDDEMNFYTVKFGDTLYSIASANNISVDKLMSLNNLTSNNISVGQKLKISEDTYEYYTVSVGDTLYTLSNKYNTSVDYLRTINNLSSDILSIGQSLKVPVNSSEVYSEYIVKSGDTLYSIAKIYNTTDTIIKELNNLNSNLLSIGQKLLVPIN